MKKSESYVYGKSTEDIINEGFKFGHDTKENFQRARAGLQRVASAVNKRVKRAIESGQISPAVSKLMSEGGKISTKGKSTLGELMDELARAKRFLEDPTSTIKGYKKFKKDFERKLAGGDEGDVESGDWIGWMDKLTKEQQGEIWRTIDKLKDQSEKYTDRSFRYEAAKYLARLKARNPTMSYDDLFVQLQNQSELLYQEQQEQLRHINPSLVELASGYTDTYSAWDIDDLSREFGVLSVPEEWK